MHILLVVFLACAAVWVWGRGHWVVPLTLSLPYVPFAVLMSLEAFTNHRIAVAGIYTAGLWLIWLPNGIQRQRRKKAAMLAQEQAQRHPEQATVAAYQHMGALLRAQSGP